MSPKVSTHNTTHVRSHSFSAAIISSLKSFNDSAYLYSYLFYQYNDVNNLIYYILNTHFNEEELLRLRCIDYNVTESNKQRNIN